MEFMSMLSILECIDPRLYAYSQGLDMISITKG